LIQGYAEGLKEGINDDPESRDFYCEVIMDEANKMNVMVQKLLTLNHLEFGNDVVTMERFDIVNMVQSYLQSANILARQQGVEVRFKETEPIYVWADEFKVEEVITNYFTNALNHCTGKKVVDITIEKREGKVRISVFNTGEPVPEASLERIWDKFYKVDKARTREYGGSGVGLSIVKAIMESMNQEYGLENYTNGVRFWFELELVEE
jgi:signal transduction histidine kinase